MLNKKSVAIQISELQHLIKNCSWAIGLLRNPEQSGLLTANQEEVAELLKEFISIRKELRKELRLLKTKNEI